MFLIKVNQRWIWRIHWSMQVRRSTLALKSRADITNSMFKSGISTALQKGLIPSNIFSEKIPFCSHWLKYLGLRQKLCQFEKKGQTKLRVLGYDLTLFSSEIFPFLGLNQGKKGGMYPRKPLHILLEDTNNKDIGVLILMQWITNYENQGKQVLRNLLVSQWKCQYHTQ